jgi:glycosyltransferase involved in cell wall biosynthesis
MTANIIGSGDNERSPACSVVIPSYQSAGLIRETLTSLLSQDFEPPFEIIVVDSSPDETGKIVEVEFPQVRLVRLDEKTDPARARNTGARLARGEALAFIDSDCRAAPDWLRGLYSALQAGYDGAGGAIHNANPESLVSWAGYLSEFREFLPTGRPREVHNLTLGNAAYWNEAFWASGGFPSGCFPQEDQVFHKEFCQDGRRVWFDPGVRVSHHHRSLLRDFLNHQLSIGWANARVVRRLDLPGAGLARRRGLAWATLPGLAALRWARTVWACRRVENGLVWKRPRLAWLMALGMLAWAKGFAEAAGSSSQRNTAWSRGRRLQVVDVEYFGELPSITDLGEKKGVLALARSGRRPVGLVRVRAEKGEVSADRLRQAIQAQVQPLPPKPEVLFIQSPLVQTDRFMTIVVCTRERAGLLDGCLEALRPIAALGHEVIVVDNAPLTQTTAVMVKNYPYRYVVEPRPGLNHARNRGLAEASHDLIAFTDDDCRLDPDWPRALEAAFSDPRVGAVTGLVLPYELETPAQARFEDYCSNRRIFLSRRFSSPPLPPSTAGVAGMGANMAFRRDLLERLGGFDIRFDGGTKTLSGGDTEIFSRLLEAGEQILYAPEALVWHRHPDDEQVLRKVIYGYGAGLFAFLAKRLFEDRDWRVLITGPRWLVGPPLKAGVNRLLGRPAASPVLVWYEFMGGLSGPFRYQKARALPDPETPGVEATEVTAENLEDRKAI